MGSKGVWWWNFPQAKVCPGEERWPAPKQVGPGTFNLSKLANYWSLVSSKSSKSDLFYAIFCQFSLCNGLQSGLVGKSRATQGLISCGQVATTQAGATWHLKPAQKGHILLPNKLKIEQI